MADIHNYRTLILAEESDLGLWEINLWIYFFA